MNNVIVKQSKIEGNGLFATRDIKKDEIIGIVKGPVVPDNNDSYKKYSFNHLHAIGNGKAILNQEITKNINHSCEPNCGMKSIIQVVAMRDIKKDEEITVDYDTLEDDWEMVCNCGSKNCRKTIKGYKYLPELIKEKYEGYVAEWMVNGVKK